MLKKTSMKSFRTAVVMVPASPAATLTPWQAGADRLDDAVAFSAVTMTAATTGPPGASLTGAMTFPSTGSQVVPVTSARRRGSGACRGVR